MGEGKFRKIFCQGGKCPTWGKNLPGGTGGRIYLKGLGLEETMMFSQIFLKSLNTKHKTLMPQ